MKRVRRIVLVGHDNEGSARLFDAIVDAFPDVEFLLVVTHGLYAGKSFAASVVKLLREASWWFVFFRFIELVRYKVFHRGLARRAAAKGVRVVHSSDVNAESLISVLRQFEPDLLVSLFTMQIYKRAILEVPRFGGITSHPSILPSYRGLEVFFWVLANDEAETGVSVFRLTEKIDAGEVIAQERIPITPETTVASLYRTITGSGGRLLVEGILAIDDDRVEVIPQSGAPSYFAMPDPDSYRRFRRTGRRFF